MQEIYLADNGANAQEPATPQNNDLAGEGSMQGNRDEGYSFGEEENTAFMPKEKNSASETAEKLSLKPDSQDTADNSIEDQNDIDMQKLMRTKAFSRALNRMSEKKAKEIRQELTSQLLTDKAQINAARQIIAEDRLREDLEQIRQAFPEVAVKDPRELGEVFVKLMATGQVDAVTAYIAQKSENERVSSLKPPSTGPVGSAYSDEKEYYSPAEASRLTKKDYEADPKLIERVRMSMTKWKQSR